MRNVFAVIAVCLMAASLPARALDQDDPEAELASFKILDGFEISLFASEKDGISKPIQMRWDPQGRLYVMCSVSYPQIKPGETADDKIIILEDSDGDGKADKSTVFASGLYMPMGIEFGDGGLYVGQGSELLHFKDTDGDGKSDERRVVLRGFGTGDTHQNINNFTWSPGGELFFCQGLHAFSRVETPYGVEKLLSAGVWRLRPRTQHLDGFLGYNMGPQNPWGLVFDDYGQGIICAGNGDGVTWLDSALVKTPHYKEYPKMWAKYRKFAGGDLINGRHLPESMHGLLVTGAFMNNTVDLFAISDDGSGFTAKEQPPLITSTHTSFRPLDTKVGPDGALYICDWYNPVIGHYQASFRHPGRDKAHGRIWRVTAKGRPLVEKPKLAGKSAAELCEVFKSPERWARYQAKRVLADMDPKLVIPAVAKFIEQLDPKDPQFERVRLEAFGVYETHEVVEKELLGKLLRSTDYRTRAYATRTVGRWADRLEYPLGLLAPLAADENPRVRLEAVVAASGIPSARSIEVAASVVDKPMDKFLNFALTQAVHALKENWQPAFESGQLTFGNNTKRFEYVLKADGSKDVLGPLLNLLKSETLSAESRGNILVVLAQIGGPAELAMLLDPKCATGAAGYDAALHARLLGELANAARQRKIQPTGDLNAALQSLLAKNDASLTRQALVLGGVWKIEALRGEIEKRAREGSDAALEALADLGGEKSIAVLKELAAAKPASTAAIIALARLDLGLAADAGAAALGEMKQNPNPAPLVDGFLARNNGSDALAAALAKVTVPADCAKLALRVMSAAGREDKALRDVLNKNAGLSDEPPAYDAELVKAIVAEVKQGDPANGEKVFRGTLTNCYACHSIGGAGGQVGPDLSAVGTGMQIDMIVEAVFWPNRQVKENYSTTLVVTRDGKIFQGYRVSEDKQTLVLRDPAKETVHQINVADIKTKKEIGSVMPQGLTVGLTRTEIRDLVSFLSQLGRPGAYAVNNPAVVRRWHALSAMPDGKTDVAFVPKYALVSGELPATEFGSGILRFEVDVIKPGAFTMALNSAKGLSALVDGKPAEVSDATALNLEAGRHVVVLKVDAAARGGMGIRCEIAPAAGSAGDVRQIIGK
jgi:putative heme-binding domain-containing protein